MVFKPGVPQPKTKKHETSNHYAPKPPPIIPTDVFHDSSEVVAPAVTISRSVTRRAADKHSVEAHRDYTREKAIAAFDEAFGVILNMTRDENVNAQTRLRAAQLIIELSLDHSEAETQTETITSHLDALHGLAYTTAPKLAPK